MKIQFTKRAMLYVLRGSLIWMIGVSFWAMGLTPGFANSMSFDYDVLVVQDREVHYAIESADTIANARPIPIPKEWGVCSPPCDIGFHPNTVYYPHEVLDPSAPPDAPRMLSVFSSTNPAWLFQEPGTQRMVQIAGVMPVGENETEEGVNHTSIWYRVSVDGGATFTNLKPMIQDGYNLTYRFPGVFAGSTNGMWAGASNLIQLSNGDIVIPVSYWPLDSQGLPTETLYDVTSYSVNAVVIGQWNASHTDISWSLSQRVFLPETLSTRGALEPTVAELKSSPGTLVMISRGSNQSAPHITGRRWVSHSTDYGRSWSEPIPLCYDDGTCFFSPSSSSNLIRGPNGLLYWIGNITDENPNGNSPRYPLKMGELDEETLTIIKSSVITIDDFNPNMDSPDVQLSGFATYVDKESSTILIYLQRLDTVNQGEANAGGFPYNWYRIGFTMEGTAAAAMLISSVMLLL